MRLNQAPRPLVVLGLSCVMIALAASASAQPAAAGADAAYAEAYALFDAGLYGEAASAFEDFRNHHPRHARVPDALFYGGQAELAAGREARAARLLASFGRRYPLHPLAPRARLSLGEFYFARGDYEQAIAALNTALGESQPPDDAARALLIMGEAGLRLGRVDAAVADFSRIAEEYPRTDSAPRALYSIGYAEMNRGNYAEASEAFTRLATRYRRTPEDRRVGLALAEALLRSGQFTRVVPEVDRRLAEVPEGGQEGGLPLAPTAAGERQAFRDRGNFLAGEALLRIANNEAATERFALVDPEGPYAANAAYGRGRSALSRQDWPTAAAELIRAAEASPSRGGSDALAAESSYYAGLALRRSGRLQDATERLASATRLDPDGPYADVALFEKGMVLYVTREWDRGAGVFQSLLDRYPTSPHAGEAARMLGETYAALGDFRRAEAASTRAQDLGASSPELAGEVEFQRGYQAARDGDFTTAERILMEVYERDRRGQRAGEALFWAAEAAFQRGQAGDRAAFDRALDRFNTLLANFPEHRQRDAARYALAWTHFKRGDYARAAEAFERFLAAYQADSEIVPYTADARLRLADSYFALRRWDAAAQAYGRVQGAGADYARFQIGQSRGNAGRSEEAIAAYSQLITDFPASPLRPQARYAIGDIRFQQGNYDRAIEIFQEVIQQYPGAPVAARAQFAIGDARYNQGRLPEAVAAYRAVLERFPRSPLVPDALSAIELTLGALGREDEVARVVEQYAARNPDAGAVEELRFRQAEGRYQRGDLQGAIEEFQSLVARSRDQDLIPPALLYLARSYADLGDQSNAERHFRQLIDEHGGSPLAGEAARRLGQIYLRQQRFSEALPLFRRAATEADSASEGAEARLGEAAALVGLGRIAAAEPILAAVVDDPPSRIVGLRARLRLADVFEATGRYDRASPLYEHVARDDDGAHGAEAASRLASMLLARRDAQAVISVTDRMDFEQRFAGHPERIAEVLLSRARAFAQLGQTGRAEETFDRVVRAYGDTPAAAVARRERGS